MAKAVLLLSGGLDSTLAGKLLLDQGVEVEAVNFVSPFCRCSPGTIGCSAARNAAEQLGIPVRVLSLGDEYLDVVKHPRFGRGKRMNPCIDCRIFMFTAARNYMERSGGDFIATGEVLGERPMSQNRRAMEIIERESGLADLIVRPLSARLLPPSRPEREKLVDKDRLGNISGRRRLPQFELAERTGIKDYLCPAGGCLLTDSNFSARIGDLLQYKPEFSMRDVQLLKYGRHFRLTSGRKIVVGRNERENSAIDSLATPEYAVLVPIDITGPTVLIERRSDESDILMAAGLLARYTKGGITLDVAVRNGECHIIEKIAPLPNNVAASWLIGDRG